MSTGAEPLELGPWRPEEPPRLEAFGLEPEREAPFRPLDAAHWDWAFRRNPAGTRLHLARRGGRVVARYGALPVRTRVFGETRTFANLIGGARLAGEGDGEVLVPLAESFVAAHGGADGDLVHYGRPDERDLELGQRFLGHELLRVVCLLAREPGQGPSALPDGVEEPVRFGPEADVLYACCATHWHASAIRDAAFLNWRFVEHPARRFRLFAVRGGEALRGYAVVHHAGALAPGPALLMDWLVLPGDEEASERLLAAVLAWARAEGAAELAASFPEWSPWSLWFQERGFLHRPSEHLEIVRGAVPRFDMLWLRDNWWTTLADALIL